MGDPNRQKQAPDETGLQCRPSLSCEAGIAPYSYCVKNTFLDEEVVEGESYQRRRLLPLECGLHHEPESTSTLFANIEQFKDTSLHTEIEVPTSERAPPLQQSDGVQIYSRGSSINGFQDRGQLTNQTGSCMAVFGQEKRSDLQSLRAPDLDDTMEDDMPTTDLFRTAGQKSTESAEAADDAQQGHNRCQKKTRELQNQIDTVEKTSEPVPPRGGLYEPGHILLFHARKLEQSSTRALRPSPLREVYPHATWAEEALMHQGPEVNTTACDVILFDIPFQVTRDQVIGTIDEYGFDGMYIEISMPMPKKKSKADCGCRTLSRNMGFAFIYFNTAQLANKFLNTFQDFTFPDCNQRKLTGSALSHVQCYNTQRRRGRGPRLYCQSD